MPSAHLEPLRARLDPPAVLAVLFGLASVPWTYGFVAGLEIPLWPSFIASATFFAAGGGRAGLARGMASLTAGAAYAWATLAFTGWLGGGDLVLALLVGVAMLVASLHAYVPGLDFTPGGFFGFATMFSVHAAGATGFGWTGLAGETAVTVVSMAIGAAIGALAEAGTRAASEPRDAHT